MPLKLAGCARLVVMAAMALCAFCAFCADKLSPGKEPRERSHYSVDDLIADLKSEQEIKNKRALSFLFETNRNEIEAKIADRKKEIVQALIPYLKSDDARIVLKLLADFGPDAKDAVPSIAGLIRPSGNVRLAEWAQYTLRRIGPGAKEAIPDLIASFPRFYFGKTDSVQYRRSIPMTLSKIAPANPKVKMFFQTALKDEDLGVRVEAASQLWEQGDRAVEIRDTWAKAEKSIDPVIRARLGVLTAWHSQRTPEILSHALSMLKDVDDTVRENTIDMLITNKSDRPELVDAFITRLSDDNWYIRCCACEGLAGAGRNAKKAIPELRRLLKDEVAMVRVSCAGSIYCIDPGTSKIVVKVLEEILRDSGKDFLVRSASAKELGKIGPDAQSALPALKHALQDESSEVRKSASESINKIQKVHPEK